MTETRMVLEQRTAEIFSRLECENFRYAVLRNYDDFPRFGHDIDLVMHSDDIPRWRETLSELAQKQQWTALTECNHWGKSKSRHHNIEVFRLFQVEPASYLQIDLFHGYACWGLPLMTEEELLEDRIPDERGFTKIHPDKENFFRLMQLHRLYVWQPEQSEKIGRYRNLILTHEQQAPDTFRQTLKKYFQGQEEQVLNILKAGDSKTFCRLMQQAKRQYLLGHFFMKLSISLKSLFDRITDQLQAYVLDPCGMILRVYAPERHHKDELSNALNQLCQCNLLTSWTWSRAKHENLGLSERRILERGGFVVKWLYNKNNSELDITSLTTSDALQVRIIQYLIARHRILYTSLPQTEKELIP